MKNKNLGSLRSIEADPRIFQGEVGHLPLKYSWSALVFHENRDTIEEYQLSLLLA